MNHASSIPQISPALTTDLDSDRLEELTAEMRWARYRRGMALGSWKTHAALCDPCGPGGPGGVTQARCPEGLRLWGIVRRAEEDIETLADCLVPLPVPPAGVLF